MFNREKASEEALTIAVEALRLIEEIGIGSVKFIAQIALDQIRAATIDKEVRSA